MTPVAFFAPLKPPDHPVPSGDREIARSLLLALEQARFAATLASELRLLDIKGDATVQQGLVEDAAARIPQIVERGERAGWRAWITYHNYYKAPDLLGPAVARALGIAYVQIESTRAQKRLTGPWAHFAKAAEAAADAADAILYFTQRDAQALAAYAPAGQRLIHLAPFLPRSDLPCASDRSGAILAAAMMRPGDKLSSYRLIARTLEKIGADWRLDIAGDGQARGEVKTLMRPFGARVRFLGRLDDDGMKKAYGTARTLFWPGVNEAIGLTYLEAQAAGIPVLAQNRPGLQEVVAPILPRPDVAEGPSGLAQALGQILCNPPPPEPLREYIRCNHLLPAAAATLRAALLPLLECVG